MILIGDVHGKFSELKKLLNKFNSEKFIQLGDMGLGFRKELDEQFLFPTSLKFLRGNHDNKAVCLKQPNYLGDFGVTPEGYFFISGAYSIDRFLRTEGVDWWADEELDYAQFSAMMDLFVKTKPKIVLSHECPSVITHAICNGRVIHNRTVSALNEALFRHQPTTWFFGHYHKHYDFDFEGTRFVCLAELETMKLS